MYKRWFALAAAMLVCIACLGCGAGEAAGAIPSPQAAEKILEEYAAEVRWVEETDGEKLPDDTAEMRERLMQAAVEQYGTDRFDRLSQLVTDLIAAAWNGGDGRDAWTVVRSFGPLKGICFWEVPVGCSMAGDLTGRVEIARGELVGEMEISAPVSVEIPLGQAVGPADGTTLPDGMTVATHRIFIGVLWGVILEGPGKTSCFREDGEAEYRIACPRGVSYAHLAQIANPMYVERAGNSEIVTCAHFLDFQEKLAADPGRFL